MGGLRERIDALGTAELGRRFGARKVAQLDAMREGRDPDEVGDPAEDWVDLCCGDELDDEEFFTMIVAALAAARGHEGATWCIADGLMDELVGRNPSYMVRFHVERRANPDIQAAFRAMHNDLDSSGIAHGWWADDDGTSA